MSTQTTTTQAASGAEGFVLVPKQATKAMLDAAYAAHDAYEAAETGGWGGLGSVYEAMVAAAPVTGTEEDHRELRAVMRRLSAAKNAGGIEDAEAQAQVLGHAVDACIGQIREFLATAPQPAGAERVDLGELERLRDEIGRIKAVIPASLTYEVPDAAEAIASTFRQYVKVAAEATALRKALGSGEGTAGASSGPGSREPSPSVSASGFNPSRETLGNRVLIQVIESGYYYCAFNDGVTDRMSDAFVYSREEAENIVRYDESILRMVSPPAPCDGSGEAGETEGLDPKGDSAVPGGQAHHPQSPSLSEVEEAALSRAHADGIRAANWTLFTHEQSLAIRQKYLPAALATLTASQEQDGEVRT